jgi:general nucleoside transport system permease protein
MRISLHRRERPSAVRQALTVAGSVLAALTVAAVVLLLTGHRPMFVYVEMFRASFGTGLALTDTLASATPLIFTGLAAAVAFRVGLYNIGGEGQLYLGAIFGSGAALALGPDVGGPIILTAVVLAGILGGMVWIAIPAIARAWLGTSEIITTLLLNYVALFFMRYLIFGSFSLWRDQSIEAASFPQGRVLPDAARFPTFGLTRVNVGLVLGVAVALLLYVLLFRTSFGYSIRVFGDSPRAARYSGLRVRRIVLGVLLLSGALAGLAGATEVAGRSGRLDPIGLAINLGYTGIIVAALARFHPLGVLFVSVLLGGLDNAASSLQSLQGGPVPAALSTMLLGAILLFAIGGDLFTRYGLRIDWRAGRDASSPTATTVAGEPVSTPSRAASAADPTP